MTEPLDLRGSVIGGLGFGNKRSIPLNFGGVEMEFHPSPFIIARRLFELSNKLRSFREPLELSIREVMRPSIAKNFEVGGRPAWVPLSPKTIARKGGGKILIEKGKLKGAATQRSIWNLTREAAVIDPGALLAKAPYAGFHQAGTNKEGLPKAVKNERGKTIFVIGEVGVPARPYLMIQKEDATAIRRIFLAWLEEKIATTWGSGI